MSADPVMNGRPLPRIVVPAPHVGLENLQLVLEAAGSSLAAPYSITRSARSSTDRGMLTPIFLAVLAFTTNSNLDGCSIGSSPGFAPLRILSTYPAARRKFSVIEGA